MNTSNMQHIYMHMNISYLHLNISYMYTHQMYDPVFLSFPPPHWDLWTTRRQRVVDLQNRICDFDSLLGKSEPDIFLPNGGAKWCLTMIESKKTHQLNKSNFLFAPKSPCVFCCLGVDFCGTWQKLCGF